MANTRFALLALPYTMKELAYPKEIICDYEEGHIYVRSIDGNTDISITKVLENRLNQLGSAALKDIGISPGNIPELDSNGKLPTTILPALSITDTFPVDSEPEMLSLDAQRGDVAIRTDLSKSFILRKEPASYIENWLELVTPIEQYIREIFYLQQDEPENKNPGTIWFHINSEGTFDFGGIKIANAETGNDPPKTAGFWFNPI